MEIVINPKYNYLKDFIYTLPNIFHLQGETIYKSRNEIKVFTVGNLQLNVKQYKVPSFFNQLVYTFFRPAKVLRAYTYAFKLLEKGFDTPEPVAYILFKKAGLIHQSYLVTLQSPYSHNFYEFGKGSISEREDVVKALACYTAKLHDAEVYHCDYSPGNILFEKEGEQIHFTLIDINRMKFGRVSMEKGCANFSRLWGNTDFFYLLAYEYAQARCFDEDTCIQLIMKERNKFWKRYARRHPITFDLA